MKSQTILVINAGSSSIKYAAYKVAGDGSVTLLLRGQFDFDRYGNASAWTHHGEDCPCANVDRQEAVNRIVREVGTPHAVVHRIVMGGDAYPIPFRITHEALATLHTLTPLAPLHQPHNLRPVEMILTWYPNLLQIGSPDTGFHRTIPESRRRLPIADKWHRLGAKRWGFHGHSIESIVGKLKEHRLLLPRVVVAHLGSGASTTALLDGVSVDTSMSLSPLCGNEMATRPGELDPGVVLFMMRQLHNEEPELNVDEVYRRLEHTLYKESGLQGRSGTTGCMKTLCASKEAKAREAISAFCGSAAKQIAAMAVSLGDIDALVFTGGIGERSTSVRADIVSQLAFLGFSLDEVKNRLACTDYLSIGEQGRKPAYAICTDEELVMARAAIPFLTTLQQAAE